MDLGLAGKTALITGGSVGIGLGVARSFAREGAHVIIAARGADRVLAEAAAIATEFGVKTLGVACDVATAPGCDTLIAATVGFGGTDILVNNAGTGSNETILDAPDEKWNDYWNLHVMAAVRLSRGIAPMMQARGGGAILNNASICAVQPLSYEPIYNVTKAALVMFSKNLATELIVHNIRVNAINPGLILTPDWVKTATQLAPDGNWQSYLQAVADEHAPIKRFGSVGELADFFVFLCSDRASYCVGSIYHVDGGMLRTI